MKRIALSIVALAALAFVVAPTMAADGYYGARQHASQHSDLNHRAVHRAVEHHNAHHYPMNRYQHRSLHADLNHRAVHDQLEHRSTHRSYSPGYGQSSYGFSSGYGGHGAYGYRGVQVQTPYFSLGLRR